MSLFLIKTCRNLQASCLNTENERYVAKILIELGPPSSAPFAEFDNVKKSVVVGLISSSGLFFIIFFCWPYGLSIKNYICSWKLPKKFAEIG